MADPQDLFTTTEAAVKLRYKPMTLAVMRSQARGPAYISFGRSIRYVRRDLDEWIDGGSLVQKRIEETAECHVAKRMQTRRLRGRAAVEQRARRLAMEPHCRDCHDKGDQRLAEEVDHIFPLEEGGSDEDDNVRCLCKPCHAVRTRERLHKNR